MLVLSACATPINSAPTAVARLQGTTGNTATGSINFEQGSGKVRVRGEIRGLKPNTAHGFHVHEMGDCSGGDGESAGGHLNPDGKPHGAPDSMAHHVGDFPALQADAAGVARVNFESAAISLGSGLADVIGKGLIVHAEPDDYKTQPSGNTGARLACAVIVRS
jgi:superoxide dismutase, Cu-Zn family